jgi:hypothetical protein
VTLLLDRLAYEFVAPGLIRHRERMPDLTAATDSVACMRLLRCTLCQGALGAFQFRVWRGATVVVGVVLCGQCQRLEEALLTEAVDIMMTRRYDPTRFQKSGIVESGSQGGNKIL